MTLRFFLPVFLVGAAAAQVASPWETLMASGIAAAEQKRFSAAEQYLAMALREAEHFGSADARLASTLNTQGLVFMAAKKPKEAEIAYRRAVGIFEKTYGPKSLDVANAGLNLAKASIGIARYEQALPILARSRETFEAILGKQSAKAAETLFEQGEATRQLHRYDEAETILKRAADLQEAQGGIDSPELANTLNALALTYAEQGKFAQAEPLFKLSLNIREAKYGLDHEDVVSSLDNYAAMLRDAGRFKDSQPLTQLANAARKVIQDRK